MWLNDAIGAGTLPGTSSNIRIEPSIASTVTLPSSQTFEKFYLSTENSPVTIKGSVAAANIYMRAAQTAHPLRLEGSIFGTKNAGSSLKQVETVDNLPSLEVVNGSAIYLASAIGECDYTAFGWVWLGSTVKQTAGYFEHAGEDGKSIPGFTVRYNVAEADGTYSCVVKSARAGAASSCTRHPLSNLRTALAPIGAGAVFAPETGAEGRQERGRKERTNGGRRWIGAEVGDRHQSNACSPAPRA